VHRARGKRRHRFRRQGQGSAGVRQGEIEKEGGPSGVPTFWGGWAEVGRERLGIEKELQKWTVQTAKRLQNEKDEAKLGGG